VSSNASWTLARNQVSYASASSWVENSEMRGSSVVLMARRLALGEAPGNTGMPAHPLTIGPLALEVGAAVRNTWVECLCYSIYVIVDTFGGHYDPSNG